MGHHCAVYVRPAWNQEANQMTFTTGLGCLIVSRVVGVPAPALGPDGGAAPPARPTTQTQTPKAEAGQKARNETP